MQYSAGIASSYINFTVFSFVMSFIYKKVCATSRALLLLVFKTSSMYAFSKCLIFRNI